MPTLHKKPTPEELDANIKKAEEDLAKLDQQAETPPVEENPVETPLEEPSKPAPEVVVEPETSKEEPVVPEEEKPDYKKKFIASARESQVQFAKNRKVDEAIDKAAELPEPTEEELQKEYVDWDVMSDTEKRLAKESLTNKRQFALLHEARKESLNIEQWNDKVNAYMDDPKTLVDNPELDGREDEFKLFALKPTRRGLDFEDLTSAFLYGIEKSKKKVASKKGAMFESGSGGPNEKLKPKGDKITQAEARVLRDTNYSKWKEYLMAGKIEEVE